jgi:hypothetical protein
MTTIKTMLLAAPILIGFILPAYAAPAIPAEEPTYRHERVTEPEHAPRVERREVHREAPREARHERREVRHEVHHERHERRAVVVRRMRVPSFVPLAIHLLRHFL